MTVYTLDAIRYITASNPLEITRAEAVKHVRDSNTDRRMSVTYSFPNSVSASSVVDFQEPGWGPFGIIPHFVKNSMTIKLEGGEIYHYGLTLPHHYHKIKVTPTKGPSRVEKAYVFPNGLGQPWWSSYVLNIIPAEMLAHHRAVPIGTVTSSKHSSIKFKAVNRMHGGPLRTPSLRWNGLRRYTRR